MDESTLRELDTWDHGRKGKVSERGGSTGSRSLGIWEVRLGHNAWNFFGVFRHG